MESEEEAANFSANLQQHITTAEELCERCKALSHINGIGKLLKKCHAELKFLHGVSTGMLPLLVFCTIMNHVKPLTAYR